MLRMYKAYFHAAHHIKNHPKCGKTHGHTYYVEVSVEIDGWIDFHDIKVRTDLVLQRYDHRDLGHMTCEHLAERILNDLRNDAFPRAKWIRVRLFETPEFGVEVSE